MSSDAGKVGILAGGGRLPRLLVESCRERGRPVFVVALEEQADPATVVGVPHVWLRLGAAGKAVKALRKEGVAEIVLVGDVRKPSLKSLRPDLWTVKFLARAGGLDQGDDRLLSGLVRELEEREGFVVKGAHDLAPELLSTLGVYGAVVPDDAALADVRLGVKAALEVGARDKGQGAVARGGRVLAVEGRAGTDAMLSDFKAGPGERRSGVLVKMKKPGQEMRADLPAIGVETVGNVAGAGLCGLAVEAGGALVVDRGAVVAAADAAGIFVMGVSARDGEGA